MRILILFILLTSLSIHVKSSDISLLNSSWYPLTIDISYGEKHNININGKSLNIELININTTTDSVRGAIRSANITIKINKELFQISCGNYSLPKKITQHGIMIDCPFVSTYLTNSLHTEWSLVKDSRIRIFNDANRFIKQGVFGYPLDAELFSAKTQIGNEPTYVGGESLSNQKIYYHSDLDFGGADSLVNLYSTTDGTVLSRGKQVTNDPIISNVHALRPLSDQIIILDPMGFFHLYAHLNSFSTSLYPGAKVNKGDFIGTLGKVNAGNWSHLHYGLYAKQPSGLIGSVDAYPFIIQSYIDEYNPEIIAVARPHKLVFSGEEIQLSAINTFNNSKQKLYYEWNIDDEVYFGENVNITINKPGSYSAVLKAYNNDSYDYDSVSIKVLDKSNLSAEIPNIYPTFHPSKNIKINDPIAFKFKTTVIYENSNLCTEINFGDGFIKNICHQGNDDNSITHRYLSPGHYIVRFQTKINHKDDNSNRSEATEFLFVRVMK